MISVIAAPESADAIEHCLNKLGALGIEIDLMKIDGTGDVTVKGYFQNLQDIADFRAELEVTLASFELAASSIRSVEEHVVEDRDWISEWKKHWRPTRVGRFVVAPAWFDVQTGPSDVVIRIEPNMAFGTGTHETTKLCLRAIDELFRPAMSFLDVGTGTGILAIAAAKTARETDTPILAIDIDEDSIVIARKNAVENNVEGRIEFAVQTLTNETAAFDLVCANLTLDVIGPILPELLQRSSRALVLSGILAEQEELIVAELNRLNADSPTIWRDGEWIAVIAER